MNDVRLDDHQVPARAELRLAAELAPHYATDMAAGDKFRQPVSAALEGVRWSWDDTEAALADRLRPHAPQQVARILRTYST